ncbi:hypothetical protein K8S17_00615 [bacterium]|nr:hypothetical protein [bacterium]
MQKTVLIALIALVILATPLAARESSLAFDVMTTNRLNAFSLIDREPGDLCEICNNSYYWTVDGWLLGNESYKTYCDPTGCPDCEGEWKPISVTVYLYWAEENNCELTLSADVENIDMSNPDCPQPGTVIVASDPVVVGPFSPAGLWAITIPLPLDCPVLEEPFFASISFDDSCGMMPSLVTDAGPCEPCISWNDWGTGWQDLCDYGFPGNVSMYSTLECQGPSPVQRATWTLIKSKYRADE